MRSRILFGVLALGLCYSCAGSLTRAEEATAVPSRQATAPVRLIGDEEAARKLEEAKKLLPPESAPAKEQFRALWSLMLSAAACRDYEETVNAIRQMQTLVPNTAILYSNLSVFLGKQAKYQKAILAADKALELATQDERVRHHAMLVKASWLWKTGKHQEADALVASVSGLGEKPEEQLTYYACLSCYNADKGDEAKIEEALRKVQALIKEHTELAAYFDLIKRDIVFDPYRSKDWFIALFGKTLADSAPSPESGAVAPEAK